MKKLTAGFFLVAIIGGLWLCYPHYREYSYVRQYNNPGSLSPDEYVVGIFVKDKDVQILNVILEDVNVHFHANGNVFQHTLSLNHNLGYLQLKRSRTDCDPESVIEYVKKKYDDKISSCSLLNKDA